MNARSVAWMGIGVFAAAVATACSSSEAQEPSTPTDGGIDAAAPPASDGGIIDEPSPDAGPDVISACKALAKSICAKMQTCSPFVLGSLYGDLAGCEARNVIGCEAPFGAPGRVVATGDITACASSLPTVSCADFLARKLGPTCTIPGTRKEGESCVDSLQCESTFCAKASDEACGKCAAKTPAESPCKSGSCSDGTVCGEKDSVCHPPGTGKPGDACQQLSDCDVAHASGCNDLSKSCIPLELSASGGPCGADSIAPTKYRVCPAAGTCSGPVNGQCQAAAADGAACAKGGPSCLLPATCVAGKCTLPKPANCQ